MTLPTSCHVTGNVQTIGLIPAAGLTLLIAPEPNAVRRSGDVVIVPEPVSVTVLVTGEVDTHLVPGRYSVSARQGSTVFARFLVTVPEAPVAILAQLMDAPAPATLNAAQLAVLDALSARDAANASASAAATDRAAAQSARAGAEAARDTAADWRDAAAGSASAAAGSEDAAAASETAAAGSSASAASSASTATAQAVLATAARTGAEAARDAANTSKNAAAASAADAALSASGAATSEAAAATSASAALASKNAAQTSQSLAAGSATAAAGSASAAAGSASAAAGSASSASDDADATAADRVATGNDRTAAAASATAAAASKDAAALSASAAATSASGTASSKTASETARDASIAAKTASETARDAAVVARTGAETARTGAEAAQSAAQTARTGSETARDAAQGSATAAAASASAAAGSASSAATSATNASADRVLAQSAKTDAETARTAAQAAQTAAETARTGAQTARTGAETAQTGAQTAQAAAQAARTGAEAAQSAAAGSNTAAAAQAATAQAQASLAQGYAMSASSVVQQDLSAITVQALHRSPNAITSMFIYDTSKDSDGGAWTKRCQHTSWYNEALAGKWLGARASEAAARAVSGATTGDYFQLTTDGKFYKLSASSGTTEIFRGNKAEFPKLSAIVSEASNVTIYDLTEPGRPMWMRFMSGATKYVYGVSVSSVCAQNSMLVTGATGSPAGISEINFAKDNGQIRGTGGVIPINGNVSTRNDVFSLGATFSAGALPNAAINAVAMTTLPDAPVDPATGLRVPTIAVATNAIAVIKSNGTVVASANSNAFVSVAITPYMLMGQRSASDYHVAYGNPNNLPAAFNTLTRFSQNVAPDFARVSGGFSREMGRDRSARFGTASNIIQHLIHNEGAYAKSLAAAISGTYNTGWMTGDIRRCFLSDATAETLGGTSLISNGDFASNVSDWSSLNGGTFAWSSGSAVVTGVAANTSGMYQPITCVVGRLYRFQVTVTLGTASVVDVAVNLTAAGSGGALGSTYGYLASSQTFVGYFIATATTHSVVLLPRGVGLTATFDNVIVQEAVADRSYKAATAFQYGSLTKSALNTGTSLVGYSGFSAANYLREPYSADLDFAAGEWTASAWVNIPIGNVAAGIIIARASSTGAYFTFGIDATNKLTATAYDGTTTRTVTTTAAYNNATWIEARVRYTTDGTLAILVNGREVATTRGTPLLSLSSRYNQFTYTEQFDQSVWVKQFGSITATNKTDPNGGSTGAEFTVSATGVAGFFSNALDLVSGVSYQATVALKMGTQRYVQISGRTNGFGTTVYANFDLQTGTVTGSSAGTTTICIPLGNGWYLCGWISTTVSSATSTGGIIVSAVDSGTAARGASYTGAAGVTFQAWGADIRLSVLSALPYQRVGASSDFDFQASLTIGNSYALDAPFPGSLALLKLGATVPTYEQSQFMYDQEKQLFRVGAQSVLPDSGSIVDMAYDDATDRWIAVSAANESYWTGLVRNNVSAVPAGSYTKVAATSGVELVARSSTNPGVDVSIPAYGLREELVKRCEAVARLAKEPAIYDFVGGFTANTTTGSTAITSVAGLSYPGNYIGARISGSGIPANTYIVGVSGTTIYLSAAATATATGVSITFLDFTLPLGMETKAVLAAGALKQEGSTKDFTRLYDGFMETIRFGTAPGATAWVQVQAQRITQ